LFVLNLIPEVLETDLDALLENLDLPLRDLFKTEVNGPFHTLVQEIMIRIILGMMLPEEKDLAVRLLEN